MKICGECKTEVPSVTETCPKCGQGVRWTLKGTPKTPDQVMSFRAALDQANARAHDSVRRALEIGCVVHTCSAKPGEMCNPTPDNHGPPSDMDPEKGPWYGVHHRRWLTWLREKQSYTVGGRYVPPGVLTAAEQVYGCDVCDAPINVPCIHMRGPGLGKGEVRVVGQVQYPDGTRGVTAVVQDPATIAALESGLREASIAMGYDSGGPRPRRDSNIITSAPRQSRTAGFDQLYGKPPADKAFVKTEDGSIKELPDWKKIDPLPVDPGKDPEQLQTAGVSYLNEFQCPAMLAGKDDKEAVTCRKRRNHPGDHFAPVGNHGAYCTWEQIDGQFPMTRYTLHPAPVTYPVTEWKSGGPSEVVDLTPPQNYEAMERMIRDQLIREGAHLRSVPMPDPDETDTVVSRRHIHPGDCSSELPYDHAPGAPGCVATKKISGSLEWFKEQAKRALAVNPNITMLEFIERIGEPEYETEIQRAYHLTETELAQALLNIGCDVRCAACAETFFTGSTDHAHHCAMLAKLKCFRCGKPAVAKSQMCEEHERDEAEEIEGHIKANKELNGSSAETRKFAIARMNELDQHPGQYGHTVEGLRGQLCTLLLVAGVRMEQVNSFQDYANQAIQQANERTPGPDNDPYGEIIAHARGMVLAIQLLREGPQDAPSPLKLMLPKTPKPEA